MGNHSVDKINDILTDEAKTLSSFGKIWNHAKFQHFQMLLKFFIFSIALLTADIVTDIFTAEDFFSKDHIYWGTFTLIPIFAPFIARVFLVIANLARCWKILYIKVEGLNIQRPSIGSFSAARFSVWKHELWQLLWHFPLLQPIRYYYLWIDNICKKVL